MTRGGRSPSPDQRLCRCGHERAYHLDSGPCVYGDSIADMLHRPWRTPCSCMHYHPGEDAVETEPVDVAAEREASRLRQQKEHDRRRARRILTGRWNASPAELLEAIQAEIPELGAEDQDRVVSAAIELQISERPRVAVPTAEPADLAQSPTPDHEERPVTKPTIQPMKTADRPRIVAFFAERLRTTAPMPPRDLRDLAREELGIDVQESVLYGVVKSARKFNENRGAEAELELVASPEKDDAAPAAEVEEPVEGPAAPTQWPVCLGSAELAVLRFVGVGEEQITRAVQLADLVNSINGSHG